MNFETSMIETPCTCALHEVRSIEDVEYGTKIPLDRNGRPIGRSLQEWTDEFGRKLIEHYGEGFRHKLNYSRAERGMNPL